MNVHRRLKMCWWLWALLSIPPITFFLFSTHMEKGGVIHSDWSDLISFEKLDALLHDPNRLRYPVWLVYEFGEMAMHQFAQPDIDWRNTEQNGRLLYVRPLLRDRPDLLPLAIAYMIPLINYGDIVTDDHCLAYGATLLGTMEEEYYAQLCALSDYLGAETRFARESESQCAERCP